MDAFTTQGEQHVAERRTGLGSIPRVQRRLVKAMAFANEPQYDQAVKQHGYRRGAFDGIAGPALRFLEAQVLLAVVEGDFHRPALRVPGENLFRRGVNASR